jgi:hypothetical protein
VNGTYGTIGIRPKGRGYIRSARITCAAHFGPSSGSLDSTIEELRCAARRTGATVVARGAGASTAATFLGHGATAITEGRYIEPDRTVDHGPAELLERTLRPAHPDSTLLRNEMTVEEENALTLLDELDDGQRIRMCASTTRRMASCWRSNWNRTRAWILRCGLTPG